MDLADELAADLEEDFAQIEEDDEADFKVPNLPTQRTLATDDMEEDLESSSGAQNNIITTIEGGVKPAEELDAETVDQTDLKAVADVNRVAKLATNPAFKECLEQIKVYRNQPATDMSSSEAPEYKLIVQANNFSVEVDNEVMLVHKFVKDHYAPRFEELETLVTMPSDYCRTVLKIGNPADLSGLQNRLTGLPQAIIMVVVVTATTNTGRQLTPAEWKAVQEACEMSDMLENAKIEILTYVESRINKLAPNLSAIVGSRTATKLLGMAGGLASLARQPSCNMHLFGAQKRGVALGFSTGSYGAHRKGAGFIYNSELIQSLPEEHRMKAQRTLSAKCVLAVRMDVNKSHTDGSYGMDLLSDLEKKFEKMMEPPPSKVIKALPKPNDGPKKRRGGKKARKAKEAYATTELRKLQNRMKFGDQEEEDGAFDETIGLGMIGQSSGRIRASVGEAKSKAKLSRMNKNRLAALKGSAGTGGTVSGLSSSLAFTPSQGMELVDPSLQKRKLDAANDSWFKNDSGSFSVIPGQSKQRKLV